jgi:hypothetical protein
VPLTVMGSGFQKSAAVTSTRATVDHKTWVSSNEIDLVVSVPASAKVGQGTLTVTNGDGGAATATLTIDAKPVLTAGSPSVSPGSTQVVTVTGKQFVTGLSASTTAAGITLGSPQDVTATSFQLSVTASSSARTGKDPLTVTNPDQGQATKNILIVAS